ncbi:MAG: ATP-binding cassette domain-containing protein, partial [Burkholderiaceae bacterium]|nr:ATP-binding cassette domain-containing protein [Burkholderiaceae bacterium]
AAQALTVMHGLGFADAVTGRKVREFSGGWRNRLALARALLRPADLLLLDEPTNHLDLDSVVWLENWLKRQQATVLVISHDREFLDRCTETTWNVADGTIRRYAGNYSAFETAYLEQLKQQDAAARSYERTSAHLQKFIDRFRAQATKARQAQSRIKMLERLQAVEPARAKREWRFEFPAPIKLPERLLDAEDLRLAYATPDGERTILAQVRFLVRSGDRIGILGVNGAGKSTLVKAIAGDLAPAGGELRRGAGLAIGYFAQHQLDQLRPDETPLQHLRRLAIETRPDVREQELRDFLGQYRFSGELATRVVGPMSGGEKARCALALIAWNRPNLLLLDEPTNHLDMETREALTMALSSYAAFDGDLDDYAALVMASRRDAPGESAAPKEVRKDLRKQEAAERQRLANARKPLQSQLAKVEKELAEVSAVLREMDARLADPDFYHAGDADEVAALIKRRGELAPRVDQLEERWLELQAQLEAIA